MSRPWISVLLAGAVALTSAPALGQAVQAAPEPATDVDSVVVTGRRAPPTEVMPDLTLCIEGRKDPHLGAARALGVGPQVFVKTRLPRNPDYNAPPLTPPGSPLPEVMSIYEYTRSLRTTPKTLTEAFAADAVARAKVVAEAEAAGRPLGTVFDRDGPARMRAIRECVTGADDNMTPPSDDDFLSGPRSRIPTDGAEILARDKTLPLAFALFEDGRYEEALEQLKEHDRKIRSGEGKLLIGKIYLYALRERTDPQEAVVWLKELANGPFDSRSNTPLFDPREPERNTAMGEAAMILAEIYRDGRGPIAKDPAQSRKYLERAYVVGHIRAAKMLGDVYYQGIDTPRDLTLAFKHYMNAARFAYLPAMTAVAQMYEAGEAPGGPDPVKALAWRNQAAKADDPASLYRLAIAYDHGEGVGADPERALGLYKLSAMNGEPGAFTALGTYFYRGEGGLAQDLPTARRWFEQGALAADADGMVNLAAMMARGEGGELDLARAWAWLQIAERQGHPAAGNAARAVQARFTAEDRARVERLKRAAEAPQEPYGETPDPETAVVADFVGSAPGGPPWWTVSNGASTVWVFGLPPGRTTEAQPWNKVPLRRMLSAGSLLIRPYSPWDLVALDSSAALALPPALRLKVSETAARVRQPARGREPTLADAIWMTRIWYDRNGLTDQTPGNLLQISAREKVRTATPPRRSGPALSALNPYSEEVSTCVAAILADIATPTDASKAAGEAWANGDVAGALKAPPGVAWGCRVLWPGHWEATVGFEVEAIALALEMPGKVVVAADIGQLVAETGILPQLRARGYTVSGPTQPAGD